MFGSFDDDSFFQSCLINYLSDFNMEALLDSLGARLLPNVYCDDPSHVKSTRLVLQCGSIDSGDFTQKALLAHPEFGRSHPD